MRPNNLLVIAGIILIACMALWLDIAILNSDMPDIWKWWLLK